MGKYTNVYKGENPPKSKDVLWVHHEIKDDLTSPIVTEAYIKGKWRPQGGNGDGETSKYIEVEYNALKELRDSGNLKPGSLYRITDYVTTTSQSETRSAGNQFDIIIQAISENILSEDAKAIQSSVVLSSEIAFIRLYENDTISKAHFYIEDTGSFIWIDFDETWGDIYAKSSKLSVGDKVYYTPDYDNEAGEVVSVVDYFADSNLAAWKLKYCLDNDENRFTWAKGIYLSPVSHNKYIRVFYNTDHESYIYVRQAQLDNENGIAWAYNDGTTDVSIKSYANSGNENLDTDDIIYTQSENIYIGQILDMLGSPVTVIDFSENQGKGVIYEMVDEYNNECPYDFKNIQFLRDTIWFDDNSNWTARVFTDTIFEDYDEYNHYYYTFSYINEDFQTRDASIKEGNKINKVYNNIIKCCNYQESKKLNNIIIVATYVDFANDTRAIITNNFFDYNCSDISLGNDIQYNKIEGDCVNSVIAGEFYRNILYNCMYINITSDSYNCEFRNIDDVGIQDGTFTKCTFDSTVSGQIINDGGQHNDCIVLYNGDDVIIKKIYEDLSRT